MKRTVFILMLIAAHAPLRLPGCEVCKSNQPEALQGITHGTGPQGNMDYIIIWSAVLIVAVTLLLSLKYIFKPRESEVNHIKNIVLK